MKEFHTEECGEDYGVMCYQEQTRQTATKELLEEVLGYNIDYIASSGETYIGFHTELGGEQINIYELSFKCKEYALKRGYILDSQSRSYCKGKGICFIYLDDWTSEFPEYCLESFSADSEIEAIFEASEWIKNKKEKDNDM